MFFSTGRYPFFKAAWSMHQLNPKGRDGLHSSLPSISRLRAPLEELHATRGWVPSPTSHKGAAWLMALIMGCSGCSVMGDDVHSTWLPILVLLARGGKGTHKMLHSTVLSLKGNGESNK